MSSYFVKEFVLPKYDSRYRQNILMDMQEFELRFRKQIFDLKSTNEENAIIITYYVNWE